MGQGQSTSGGVEPRSLNQNVRADKRIHSQPELQSSIRFNPGSTRSVSASHESQNTGSRRSLIGPMRNRVKGKFPPVGSLTHRFVNPHEQQASPLSNKIVKPSSPNTKNASGQPEWTTTLTTVPTNSPSIRQSIEEQQRQKNRSSILPVNLDAGQAARSAHIDTVFGAGRQRFEENKPTSEMRHSIESGSINSDLSPSTQQPRIFHTPPRSLNTSPVPSPSPRTEYRVSAQPSHPSIVELPEAEGAEVNSQRSSIETIRTASNVATANGGGGIEDDSRPRAHLEVPNISNKNEDGSISRYHDKRRSDLSNASSEAPSTASGVARRATDKANQQTLLAYWQNSDEGRQSTRPSSTDFLTPPIVNLDVSNQNYRHSWSSNRSAARSPGEPRNLSPYRQVAGRWTSHWEDRRGLGISDSTDTIDAQATAKQPTDSSPVEVSPSTDDNETSLERFTKPSSELEVDTNLNDGKDPDLEKSPDKIELPNLSPSRSHRKPVPDHEFGPAPASPIRESVRLSQAVSTLGSESDTSKRISDQSHLSSVTGALHQHVEKLRAGPSYKIDEDGSYLLSPQQRGIESTETASPTIHGSPSAKTITDSLLQSSPQQKRGRALSLSLMARLKNRTRKNSDTSVLAARSSPFNRIESPSPNVSNVPLSSPQTPQMALTPTRKGKDLSTTYEAASVALMPSAVVQSKQTSPTARLYQLARRPSRKAAPTIASSDANVISSSRSNSSSQINVSKFNQNASLINAKSGSVQRKRSGNLTVQRQSRPASIASRRSSRSKRSSNTSLRAAAASQQAFSTASNNAQFGSMASGEHSSVAVLSSASSSWWNPWSRKNSVASLLGSGANNNNDYHNKDIIEEDQGWIDEPTTIENDRGIVSPVAEDVNRKNVAGPEKVQQPWSPAWSNRILHARGMSESSQSSFEQRMTQQNRTIEASVQKGAESLRDSPPLAVIGHHTPMNKAASSSFSSLAPLPTPAPVPPPRKHRRRGSRRAGSDSQMASSSSANSPVSPSNDDESGMMRNMSKDGLSSANSVDEEHQSPIEPQVHDPKQAFPILQDPSQSGIIRNPNAVYSSGVVDLSQTGLSNTDTRESLLSDDLDYAPTVRGKTESISAADELDNAATMSSYRSSLFDSRRSRNDNGQHPYANLSPVREIMTPESRVPSDDRSGALSAASTFDAFSHRRVNSGASMGVVAIQNAAVDHLGNAYTPERRPLPAPSVLAEPRADMASVHRTNSMSSSFSPSTAGGQASVSSMKKHTGEISSTIISAEQAASLAKAQRSSTIKGQPRTNSPSLGSRIRASSMPSKPRSPLAISAITDSDNRSPPPSISPQLLDRQAISPSLAARLSQQSIAATARESWRSSDGPWDGKVVDLGNAVALPAAKGVTKPITGTVRKQRSRSSPFALQDVLNAAASNSPHDIQREERMMMKTNDFIDETVSSEAVPFAETAVQASLAALQALEKSEEAQAGDWRARWASEKLLGFTNGGSYLSVPGSAGKSFSKETLQVPSGEDLSDYSGARSRRRAEPYPSLRAHAYEGSASSIDGARSGAGQSSAAAAAARRRARSRKQEASQVEVDGYASSIIGGGLTSDSEVNRSRHSRSQRRRRSKSASGKSRVQTVRGEDRKQNSDSPSPSQTKRALTIAEWDEIVVPAHAKRIEQEAAEEARLTQEQSLLSIPSGMVAAGSPTSPTFSQTLPGSTNVGDSSMMSMIDHGDDQNYPEKSLDERRKASTHSRRREGTETTNVSDRRLPGLLADEGKIQSSPRRQRSTSGVSTSKRHTGRNQAVAKEDGYPEYRHGKHPTNSSVNSIARSTRSSSRKGYGCDDIVAWQASLSIAALPSVSEF